MRPLKSIKDLNMLPNIGQVIVRNKMTSKTTENLHSRIAKSNPI
jgi:hypothetical protein